MILPKTNLSILMVRNAVEYPSTDLGTLCSCNKINKWSKYKPVRYNFTTNRPEDWWKGVLRNCGLNIRGYTTIAQFITDIRNDVIYWNYEQPTGGASSPYRLGDFAGYKTDAQPPVFCSDLPSVIYKDIQSSIGIGLDINGVDPEHNLQLTDFSGAYPLSDYYFGIILVRSDQTAGQLITSSQKISEVQGDGVSIPTSALEADRDYDFACCLSSIKQTTLGPNTVAGNFVPAPVDNVVQRVSIKSNGVAVFISGTWKNNTSTYRIDVTNEVTSPNVTLTNISVTIAYRDYNENNDALEVGESNTEINNIVVPFGQSQVVTGTVLNSLYDYKTRGGKLIVTYTLNGVTNRIVGQFEEEA